MTDRLKSLIYQAVGEASMSWEPRPTGVFDTTAAKKVAEKLVKKIDSELKLGSISFQDAFKVFTKRLRRDKGLYLAYRANIAMAYQDCAHWEGSRDSSAKRHAIGNRAADHFLKLLLTPVRQQKKQKKGSK